MKSEKVKVKSEKLRRGLTLLTLLTHLTPLAANAGVPLRWQVETSRLAPVQFDAVHGETLDLQADFTTYAKPLQLTSNIKPQTFNLFYQTNGMGSAWWTCPASVASNRVTAVFAATNDPGASAVSCFLGSTGSIYRAAFTIRFRHGPGATPNALALPVQTIDFSKVTVLNPPWSGGGGGSSSVDTNAVNDLIGVATNAVVTNAAAAYFPNASGLAVSNTVEGWETYWQGDSVKLEVTNYNDTVTGELPRLRIVEKEGDNWITVWDEKTRETNAQVKVIEAVNAATNGMSLKLSQQVTRQTNNKAPRAWQEVTSAGEDAPPNTVWHTAPTTVFAGGTEYAHVSVGTGGIYVLTDNGAPAYTVGEEGKWRIQTDDGNYYFGFDVASSYTLGCRTDGIEVDPDADGNQIVTLTYDVTTSTMPTIYTTTNLTSGTWTTATVTWDDSPASGTQVAYVNAGTSPQGFYKAVISHAGGAAFKTNMKADFGGGILCTNGTDAIEAVRDGSYIYWRTTDGTASSQQTNVTSRSGLGTLGTSSVTSWGDFDFNGGTNMIQTLYTVLTNIIIQQRGSISNPPTFE